MLERPPSTGDVRRKDWRDDSEIDWNRGDENHWRWNVDEDDDRSKGIVRSLLCSSTKEGDSANRFSPILHRRATKTTTTNTALDTGLHFLRIFKRDERTRVESIADASLTRVVEEYFVDVHHHHNLRSTIAKDSERSIPPTIETSFPSYTNRHSNQSMSHRNYSSNRYLKEILVPSSQGDEQIETDLVHPRDVYSIDVLVDIVRWNNVWRA